MGTGPPPPGYVCGACNVPGHYFKDCQKAAESMNMIAGRDSECLGLFFF